MASFTPYRTVRERQLDADRAVCLPRTCPTCKVAPGEPCTLTGHTPTMGGPPTMSTFHPTRRPLAPRPSFGRCACGRPIRTRGAVECAECD